MKYFLLLLCSFSSLTLVAQHGEHHRASEEKIEAQKIAFFTQKLELTPAEAQVFWPVYNEYARQKKELRKNRIRHENVNELNDTTANEYINAILENKERSLALEKEYVEKFQKILPPKKVLKLMVLERKFKEEVLKDLKRRFEYKH